MDINNIELPDSVVALLYPSTLIDEGRSEPDVISQQVNSSEQIPSLGGNQQHILIIVNDSTVPFLQDEDLQQLTAILTACKLSMADVALVNVTKMDAFSYKEMLKKFNARIVLLFDLEPAVFGLPMNFPAYQIQPFAGTSFLYSISLRKLTENTDEKLKLWQALKRLFNL